MKVLLFRFLRCHDRDGRGRVHAAGDELLDPGFELVRIARHEFGRREVFIEPAAKVMEIGPDRRDEPGLKLARVGPDVDEGVVLLMTQCPELPLRKTEPARGSPERPNLEPVLPISY